MSPKTVMIKGFFKKEFYVDLNFIENYDRQTLMIFTKRYENQRLYLLKKIAGYIKRFRKCVNLVII